MYIYELPEKVQEEIDDIMEEWGLNFEKLADLQRGKIAEVFGATVGLKFN